MPPGAEHICVVIGRTRHKMIQAEIQEAAKRGARMIEVRLDFLAKAPDFKRLLASKPCPLVATVRRQEDGGRWNGTESQRRMLLRQAIVAGFDWVDLETDVADEIARFRKVKRIISYHNLEDVPSDLENIYEEMCRQDPDVVKIAVAAQKPTDNLRVLGLLRSAPKPTIALCLGDIGFPSRILGAKLGAPFSYAAFNRERTVALGIPAFDDMKKIYHYPQLNADTQVFGLIGDPVAHSLSPLIHNAAFHKLGINAAYIPFRVPRGELEAFLRGFDQLNVKGYSITIPHKEGALLQAKYPDTASSIVGAANTLIRNEDGFAAFNTDYQAARDSILAHLEAPAGSGPAMLDGRAVMLLGAGGVARAVAHALHREGALVTITNRTLDRAQQLASEVGCRFVPWEARHQVLCSVLVNCTSVGMHPNVDEIPIHPSYLTPDMMVFDTVYMPENTVMIKEGRARGCLVLTGVDMFIRQAELQFKMFSNQDPPADLMPTLVRRALSPVALEEEET
jgi:3-dehydroquinate dehydratase/shikimate dehydrogenase